MRKLLIFVVEVNRGTFYKIISHFRDEVLWAFFPPLSLSSMSLK